MLRKLIKHEFISVSRFLLPLHLALILVTILGRFYVQFALTSSSAPLELFNLSLLMFYSLILFALMVVTWVFLYILRPLRNLFSDQGYLMHTLPVTPSMLIISKLITAMCWLLLDFFLVWVSIFCMVVNKEIIKELPELLDGLRNLIIAISGLPYGIGSILLVIDVLLSVACALLLAYMCLAVGYSFNQCRLLIAAGIWMGIQFLSQIPGIILCATTGIMPIHKASLFTPNIALNSANGSTIALFMDMAFSLIAAAAAFYITHYFMTKRLNLE